MSKSVFGQVYLRLKKNCKKNCILNGCDRQGGRGPPPLKTFKIKNNKSETKEYTKMTNILFLQGYPLKSFPSTYTFFSSILTLQTKVFFQGLCRADVSVRVQVFFTCSKLVFGQKKTRREQKRTRIDQFKQGSTKSQFRKQVRESQFYCLVVGA